MKIEEGKFYRTRDGRKVGPMVGEGFKWVDGFGGDMDPEWSNEPVFKSRRDMVERVGVAKPKTWGEMTDEEKGALLLAEHEGKDIQALALDHDGSSWVRKHLKSQWFDHVAYRVKPEREVETVTLYSFRPDEEFGNEYRDTDTHRITFDLIDGKPDCASIKMEEI